MGRASIDSLEKCIKLMLEWHRNGPRSLQSHSPRRGTEDAMNERIIYPISYSSCVYTMVIDVRYYQDNSMNAYCKRKCERNRNRSMRPKKARCKVTRQSSSVVNRLLK